MSFARPIKIPSKPFSSPHSKKNALETALRRISQEARQSETLRSTSAEPAPKKTEPSRPKNFGSFPLRTRFN